MSSRHVVPVIQALAAQVAGIGKPVLLRYEIAREAWRLYRAPDHEGRPLLRKRDRLDAAAFSRLERRLQANGVVRPVAGVAEHAGYSLIGAPSIGPLELVCLLDPFAYVSHLSAMQFHGLTDRLPEQIYVSSPAPPDWRRFAMERMQKDLGDDWTTYEASRLPRLERLMFSKIAGRPVHRYSSVHLGNYRTIKDSPVRVAAIGRTFLDMLHEPNLCGGITHIVNVFREHGATYLRLIVDEFDAHGAPIDKVRAGFLLEGMSHVRDARIDAWTSFAKRGGSRKLDAAAEYSSEFSERWCLSLNVPSLQRSNV